MESMNRFPNLLGPAARHADLGHRGTTSVEWAILAIVIVILVIVTLLLVDALVRRRRQRLFWSEHAGHDRPLAVLRMRYARGEIGHDDYLRALAALGGPQEQAATEPDQEAQNPEGKETQPRTRRGRS
jgi:hypothetical protein